MRKLFLLSCSLSWLSLLCAQNDLSGIINSYTRVSAIDNCASSLTVGSADGFETGQPVLLIQMQGAAINTDNSAAFGTVTAIGGAGLFERAVIAAISGNTITLESTLINQYDPAGGLQLVSFPRYADAVVTGPVVARPWDGSTGGVVAFEVTGALVLQAPVVADGAGFRGGISDVIEDTDCRFLNRHDDYRYNRSNWRGAPKGEGVAAPVPGMEVGRGPQANGGGGGNDHNSGGGGGANTGAGGLGGKNNEPSTFGCKGNFPGLGGRALTAAAGRLFPGGGGGAGHENNEVGTDGGNGGGIVLIIAGTIEGNGQLISANGSTATTASQGDGAGGGGGGGTIVLQAAAINGGLNLEARGGSGGNVDNRNQDRCFGPGGGGGGGRIITNRSNAVTAVLSGGAAGLSTNSSACGTSTNDATPGVDGRLETTVTIPESTTPAAPPAITSQPTDAGACLGGAVTFTTGASGAGASYQWQVDRGSGFTDLADNGTYSGSRTTTLTIRSITEAMGAYRYRMLLTSVCFDPISSEPAAIVLQPLPTAAFGYTVNGNAVTFNNQSQNASSLRWDFGDGNTSTLNNPVHTFAAGGDYTVTLTATNDCGSANRQATITLRSAPRAAFRVQPSEGCPTLTVTFTNQSSDNAESFRWNFPGGLPETSAEADPVVSYSSPGVYDAQLIATNDEGSDTFRLDGAVRVFDPTLAGFTVAVSDRTVTFTNTSSGADTFAWDFGDGNRSTEFNPVHTFSADGVYIVTLTASGECGPDVQTLSVSITTRPQAAFTAVPEAGCRPLSVRLENQSSANATSFSWQFPGGNPTASAERNPVVTYEFAGAYDVQLIATNAEGSDTLRRPGIITITDRPAAGFGAITSQRTVSFSNTTAGDGAFSWDFGDGNSSAESNPRHTYQRPGRYTVTLTATNGCGSTEATREVTAGVAPQANFSADYSNGCMPHLVRFSNTSTGDYESYLWTFPGGQPATSTEANPQVVYSQPGDYDVTLSVDGPLGANRLTRDLYVKVRSFPETGFTTDIRGDTIFLTNNSSGADRYFWDFGDGNTSTEKEPVHVYDQGGVYTVTLNAQNGSCASALSEVIAVVLTAAGNPFGADALRIFPNPTAGNLTIAITNTRLAPLQGRLFNAHGQVLWQQNLSGDSNIDLSPFPSGVYFLVFQKDGKYWGVKVVRE